MRGLAFVLLLAGAGPAQAQLYSYVDEDGVLHFTTVERPKSAPASALVGDGGEGFGGEQPIVVELPGRSQRVLHPVDVTRFDPIFERAASHYALPFALLKAVAKVESNFDPAAVSPKQAKGLMQLMDATASSLDVEDPFDPEQNIFGGARYLRMLVNQFQGDLSLAAAAYNSGPDRVQRLGRIPNIEETKRYVKRVLQMYRYYTTGRTD